MKIFLDCEFTGLHKDTTIISIGIVSDDNRKFYAEFTDFDRDQVDDWIDEHVISNLQFRGSESFRKTIGNTTLVHGDKEYVGAHLRKWLSQFKKVELWSDCHHYDIVLFHDIFGGAFVVPENVYYIPYDISTAFRVFGIDPDIKREDFIDEPITGYKHNALYDALVIQACFDKLYRNRDRYPFLKDE